ncbi:MAG TPA: HNH endonuclease [Candidatus Acidoferrales bacterium]
MSLRPGAPYADRIEDDGKTLIYEGHDRSKSADDPNPKTFDQPKVLPSGRLTQNGLFLEAALAAKAGSQSPENVKVYDKIKNGIWSFAGLFQLVDGWQEKSGRRKVFKFKLIPIREESAGPDLRDHKMPHNRLIPTSVKIEVWKRDGGKCIRCGSSDNLHFDHDIPYSLGGSSKISKNIQLLCARHNLQKHDRLE